MKKLFTVAVLVFTFLTCFGMEGGEKKVIGLGANSSSPAGVYARKMMSSVNKDRPSFAKATIAKSTTTEFQGFLGIGNEEDFINKYAVPNSKSLYVGVYQVIDGIATDVRNPWFSSISLLKTKSAIDEYYREILIKVAQGCFTNPRVNKDRPFGIFASTTRYDPEFDMTFLGVIKDFNLVKVKNNYLLPDFSEEKLGLPGDMMFRVPKIKWARIENSKTNQWSELDSRFDTPIYGEPNGTIDLTMEVVLLPINLALSGKLKISIFNGTFSTYGSNGLRMQETPINIGNLNKSSFQILGGDPGRVLSLQKTKSIDDSWYQVSRLTVGLYGVPLNFGSTILDGFYRVMALEEAP